METQETYKSFNDSKSFEELFYNLKKEEYRLLELQYELQFYLALLYKSIFKPRVMNLYETLARFKYDIGILEEKRLKLLNKLGLHILQIKNKMNLKDLNAEYLLREELDGLESEISSFHQKTSNFKLGFFEYLQSTILN